MAGRPGASIGGERDLHFLLLADCSGSMANDGRIQALNVAIKEALPHLRAAAAENPHARLLFRAVAFSSGARWHIETPTPIEEVRWQDLTAGGYTDLGEALRLVVGAFSDPRMAAHILPPAIVLISDGRPTDDYLARAAHAHGPPDRRVRGAGRCCHRAGRRPEGAGGVPEPGGG